MKKAFSVLIGAFLLAGCRTTPNGSHCSNMVWDPLSMDMGKTICETGKLCNESTGQCEIPSLSTKLPAIIGDSDVKFAVPGSKDVSKVEVLGMLIPFSAIDANGETPPQISLKTSDLGSLPVCGPIDVVLVKSDGDRVVLRDAIANKFATWKYSQLYSDVSGVPAKSLNFSFANNRFLDGSDPFLTYIDGENKFGFSAMRGLVASSGAVASRDGKNMNLVPPLLTDYLIGNFSAQAGNADIIFMTPPSTLVGSHAYAEKKSFIPISEFLNFQFSSKSFPVTLPKSLIDSGIVKVSGQGVISPEVPVALFRDGAGFSYIATYTPTGWMPAAKVQNPMTHLSLPGEIQDISVNGTTRGGGITENEVFTLSYDKNFGIVSPKITSFGLGKVGISIASTINGNYIRHYVLVKNGVEKELKYYDGQGADQLKENVGSPIDKNAESIELRDVNCDGRLDVIVKSSSQIFAYLVDSRNQLEAEPKLLYEGPEFRKSSMWNSQDRAPYQILGVQSTDGTLQLFKQQ